MKRQVVTLLQYLAIIAATLIIAAIYLIIRENIGKNPYPVSRNFASQAPNQMQRLNSFINSSNRQTELRIVPTNNEEILVQEETKPQDSTRFRWIGPQTGENQSISLAPGHKLVGIDRGTIAWIQGGTLGLRKAGKDSIILNEAHSAILLDQEGILMLKPIDSTENSKLGFFIQTPNKDESLKLVLELDHEDGYPNRYVRHLAYDGAWGKSGNYLTYTCLHLSNIYIFATDGQHLHTIQTKDQVPYPKFTLYRDIFTFERGRAFNTNRTSWVNESILNVISTRVKEEARLLIVDQYDLHDGHYKQSITLTHKDFEGNRSVNSSTVRKNFVILGTKNGLFTFPQNVLQE